MHILTNYITYHTHIKKQHNSMGKIYSKQMESINLQVVNDLDSKWTLNEKELFIFYFLRLFRQTYSVIHYNIYVDFSKCLPNPK